MGKVLPGSHSGNRGSFSLSWLYNYIVSSVGRVVVKRTILNEDFYLLGYNVM
jgi:hypothetical protein